MFDWIHGLPFWAAKAGAIILFLGILIITWMTPAEFIYHGAPDRARWRDLRIWASLLLLIQCAVYFIF